jgi:DNA-binding CsgD family transcriptional regulator
MKNTAISAREMTVLRYLAWGYTNTQVAMFLALSVKTIEAHKANGMRKLKFQNRAALVRYAVNHGWLDRDGGPDEEHKFTQLADQEQQVPAAQPQS